MNGYEGEQMEHAREMAAMRNTPKEQAFEDGYESGYHRLRTVYKGEHVDYWEQGFANGETDREEEEAGPTIALPRWAGPYDA